MRKESIYKIFAKIPTLSTERLTLRKIELDDIDDMYEYAKDPEVTRYLLWRPHPCREYTRSYLEYLAGRYRLGAHYEWAMIHRESGRMIGTCGFAGIDCPNACAELGYVLNPDFRGQGLVVEAARCVMDFASTPWASTALRRGIWSATMPRGA